MNVANAVISQILFVSFVGSGLAFVAFPTALSMMPVPQLWSVLFFVTLIAVVFDSLVNFLLLLSSSGKISHRNKDNTYISHIVRLSN